MVNLNEEHKKFEVEKTNKILDEIDFTNENLQSIEKEVKKIGKQIASKEDSHGSKIIQQEALKDVVMTVKEYDSTYIGDINMASDIYHAQKLGMKLRQLEVELRNGAVAFDSGSFLDSLGNIKLSKTSMNPKELIGGVFRKMNEETFFRPIAQGTGHISFESSFKFITLLPVVKPTRMVLEKGIYLASAGNFEFKTTKNLNPGYMLMSNKGIFQTEVNGQGILALELPVHKSELQEHKVTPDNPYRVNGDYVIMWGGNLKRSVTTMGKFIGSVTAGTGLLEEYSGTGTVWTAKTLGYYKNLSNDLHNTGLGGDRTEDLENNTDRGKRKNTFWQNLFIKK